MSGLLRLLIWIIEARRIIIWNSAGNNAPHSISSQFACAAHVPRFSASAVMDKVQLTDADQLFGGKLIIEGYFWSSISVCRELKLDDLY